METSSSRRVTVRLPIENASLQGDLTIPDNATGVVLFVHGSGSNRHSTRNRYVAEELQKVHFATFLLDLLTEQEEKIDRATKHLRFNIEFLCKRLMLAANWIKNSSDARNLKFYLFGASTGAAAALIAAAQRQDLFHALVSRGGRADLAGDALPLVKAPTLLIAGELDSQISFLNQYAYRSLTCQKQFVIVPGATHLFEEPGTLETVARITREWFLNYL